MGNRRERGGERMRVTGERDREENKRGKERGI